MGKGEGFTAAQAVAKGQSYMQLSRGVRRGALVRAWRGLYSTTTPTFTQRLLLASLPAPGPVAISHRAAARLHQLWGFESEVVELTVSGGRRFRRAGVTVHRAEFGEEELCTAGGVSRVTDLPRTLIDLARICTRLELAMAFESAWRQARSLPDALEARLEDVNARGRRGIAFLRELIADARARQRPLDSPLEVELWRFFHDHGLPLPLTGVEIDDGDPKKMRADFMYRERRLIIETDGYEFHRDYDRFLHDCRKQTRAAVLGYQTMRICKADLQDQALLKNRFLDALGGAPPRHGLRWGGVLPWPKAQPAPRLTARAAPPAPAAGAPPPPPAAAPPPGRSPWKTAARTA
jgi:very-short-patch-repair endonuclease